LLLSTKDQTYLYSAAAEDTGADEGSTLHRTPFFLQKTKKNMTAVVRSCILQTCSSRDRSDEKVSFQTYSRVRGGEHIKQSGSNHQPVGEDQEPIAQSPKYRSSSVSFKIHTTKKTEPSSMMHYRGVMLSTNGGSSGGGGVLPMDVGEESANDENYFDIEAKADTKQTHYLAEEEYSDPLRPFSGREMSSHSSFGELSNTIEKAEKLKQFSSESGDQQHRRGRHRRPSLSSIGTKNAAAASNIWTTTGTKNSNHPQSWQSLDLLSSLINHYTVLLLP
jgi:hypothetical protein